MTDAPGTDDDTGVGRGSGPTTGPPRWVIASGIVALVLLLLVGILLITGGGRSHGPARHGGMGGNQQPAAARPMLG